MDNVLLEDLWSSNNPSKLLEFFAIVNTPKKAFTFASKRIKADTSVYFSTNYSKVCFIVPTKNATDFKKSTYWNAIQNYDVVIVESNGKYFNYANSVNNGIREALKNDYECIVISNDDMLDFGLKNDIEKVLPRLKNYDLVYPSKSYTKDKISVKSNLFGVVEYNDLFKYITYAHEVLEVIKKKESGLKLRILQLLDSLQFSVFFYPKSSILYNVFNKVLRFRYEDLPLFTSFGLFNPSVLEEVKFDDVFINGHEDFDFSMRLKNAGYKYTSYPFQIKDIRNQSLGPFNGGLRSCKNVLNDLLISYKVKKYE